MKNLRFSSTRNIDKNDHLLNSNYISLCQIFGFIWLEVQKSWSLMSLICSVHKWRRSWLTPHTAERNVLASIIITIPVARLQPCGDRERRWWWWNFGSLRISRPVTFIQCTTTFPVLTVKWCELERKPPSWNSDASLLLQLHLSKNQNSGTQKRQRLAGGHFFGHLLVIFWSINLFDEWLTNMTTKI